MRIALLFFCVFFEGLLSYGNGFRYSGNPILPDNFADPALLIDDGSFYIYSTSDCGTVWYSKDFVNWRHRVLNWPTSTKKKCQWAPCIRKAGNFYYLYYSLDSQIYVAKASSPLGPFENLIPDGGPFIKDKEFFPPTIHSIDADLFIDDDNKAYLYWGSGWNFKNGLCAAAELNSDMSSFKTVPQNITPQGYFEGPHMLKHGGKYYLMYSDGVFTNNTYCLKYSVSDSPLGPFRYGKNNPILITDKSKNIYGPGHHYTAKIADKYYIIYHKLEYPRITENRGGTYRQICIDELVFDKDGEIKKVIPTHRGVKLDFAPLSKGAPLPIKPLNVESSAPAEYTHGAYNASKAFDGNFGTLWEPADSKGAWISADFGKVEEISAIEPFFASVRSPVKYKIEYSADEPESGSVADVKNWQLYCSLDNADTDEWPQRTEKPVKARFVRLKFTGGSASRWGLWELKVFKKE